MKRLLAIMLPLLLLLNLLSGCGSKDTETDPTVPSGDNAAVQGPVDVDYSKTDADMFTDRDLDGQYSENSSILIQLNGDSATASSDSVQISGSVITITENTTHILSGKLDNGMIIVNADDTAKLQLVLNGAEIHSETSAALYILEADKVFVTLAAGTENMLSNGGTFTAIDENCCEQQIIKPPVITHAKIPLGIFPPVASNTF